MLGRSDQDAKDWVAKAITLYKKIGKAAALAEFSNPHSSFVQDDMYIFVLNCNGTVLAHGVDERYIGEDFIGIKDSRGKRFIIEIIETANTQGSGFIEYTWCDPVKKQLIPKRSYFEKVDNLIICSGVYQKMWEEQY